MPELQNMEMVFGNYTPNQEELDYMRNLKRENEFGYGMYHPPDARVPEQYTLKDLKNWDNPFFMKWVYFIIKQAGYSTAAATDESRQRIIDYEHNTAMEKIGKALKYLPEGFENIYLNKLTDWPEGRQLLMRSIDFHGGNKQFDVFLYGKGPGYKKIIEAAAGALRMFGEKGKRVFWLDMYQLNDKVKENAAGEMIENARNCDVLFLQNLGIFKTYYLFDFLPYRHRRRKMNIIISRKPVGDIDLKKKIGEEIYRMLMERILSPTKEACLE